MTEFTPLHPHEPEAGAAPAIPVDETKVMRELLEDHVRKLDVIFVDFCDRAVEAFEDWPENAVSFLRLALRAQTNCRASLAQVEKLDRAHRAAREQ